MVLASLSSLLCADDCRAQFVLAEWNFPNNPDDAIVDNTSFPANSTKTITTFGGPVIGFNLAGFTTRAAGNNGWNAGNGTKGWQIEISTLGHYNMELSSKQASSNSGPRDWRLQYRVPPSVTWTDIVDVPAVTGNTAWTTGRLNNIALPAACENNASVFLRWVMRSNTDVQGNTVAAGGTSRIDDIVIVANITHHFRTVGSGNWHDPAIWEASPDGNDPWSATAYAPSYHAQTITIRNGHAVTLSAYASMDQLTIDAGGTLDYAGGVQDIRDGTGVDMRVNGTFIDASTNNTIWEGSATWALGGGGTYVKSAGTSVNNWRDRYHGTIINMAETAHWIYRRSGTAIPSVSAIDFVYPNLTFENFHTAGFTATFTGASGSAPLVLGTLDLGGSGTNTVQLNYNNTNPAPMSVLGDLVVRAGGTLSLGGSTGISVDGDVLCDGTVTHITTGTTERRITLREGNPQSVSGVGTFSAHNLTIDKPANDVALGMSINVANNLDLLSGRILNNGTSHVVTLSATASVTNASDNSFITGKVRKLGSAAFIFPVGKGGDMQPIAMGPSPNPGLETFDRASGNCASGCLADGYATNMGTWTVTQTGANGVAANNWYISNSVVIDVVTCAPSLGNATLHIGPSVAGVCGVADCDAVYNDAAANITDLRAESPVINMTGLTATGITFNVQHQGTVNDGDDRVSLWIYNGSAWVFVINLLGGSTCSSYSGGALTGINNVPNARIGFRWQNDGDGARNQKSFAVDNIRITTAAVTESYVAEYLHDDPQSAYNDIVNAPLDHVSHCEYWTLDREVGTHPRNVTLSWDLNSCGVTDPAALRVAHFDTTAATASWFDRGNTATTGDVNAGTITSGPNTLFGPFTLSSVTDGNPLPVTLVRFSGQTLGNNGHLHWTTASEKNNAWFEVLSVGPDRTAWEEMVPIGRVPGAGDSRTPLDYAFVDDRPAKRGIYYYRLKQVDTDGTSSLSNVIALEFGTEGPNPPLVSPNPFTNDAFVFLDVPFAGTLEVVLTNALGQRTGVATHPVEQGRFSFPLNDLVPATDGVYFMEMKLGGWRTMTRLVRQ